MTSLFDARVARHVDRIRTWTPDVLLVWCVASTTIWCVGDCAMDADAISTALEKRLEAVGIVPRAMFAGWTRDTTEESAVHASSAIDQTLTAAQVARIEAWPVNTLLDQLVADGTRELLGDGAAEMLDGRVVTQALERQFEDQGIARKAHTPDCTVEGGYYRSCCCPWVKAS